MNIQIESLKSQCNIISVADALGCLPHYKTGNYYRGQCPDGHDSKGGKCFVIWPEIQGFKCYHNGKEECLSHN